MLLGLWYGLRGFFFSGVGRGQGAWFGFCFF